MVMKLELEIYPFLMYFLPVKLLLLGKIGEVVFRISVATVEKHKSITPSSLIRTVTFGAHS